MHPLRKERGFSAGTITSKASCRTVFPLLAFVPWKWNTVSTQRSPPSFYFFCFFGTSFSFFYLQHPPTLSIFCVIVTTSPENRGTWDWFAQSKVENWAYRGDSTSRYIYGRAASRTEFIKNTATRLKSLKITSTFHLLQIYPGGVFSPSQGAHTIHGGVVWSLQSP